MAWAVVRGEYREGVVRPLEKAPSREGAEVLILFPERAEVAQGRGVWQQIKREIAREMPALLTMTAEERRADFDRLSSNIAENMPYRSVEEFERAMRGDEYGLTGY
jgi:predicted DNA-binding antitoxin AbrB/MazE fold protein